MVVSETLKIVHEGLVLFAGQWQTESKLPIPTIYDDKEGYDKFVYTMESTLQSIGLLDQVNRMVDSGPNRANLEFRMDANPFRGLVVMKTFHYQSRVRVLPPATANSWENHQMTRCQVGFLVQAGTKFLNNTNSPIADNLVTQNNVSFLPEILEILKTNFGRQVSESGFTIMQQLMTEPMDQSKLTIGEYVGTKMKKAEKLRQQFLNTPELYADALKTSILVGLPSKYSQLTTQLRADPKVGWREIEERVKQWDDYMSKSEKSEKIGNIFHAKNRKKPKTPVSNTHKVNTTSDGTQPSFQLKQFTDALTAFTSAIGQINGKGSNFSSNTRTSNFVKKPVHNFVKHNKGHGKGNFNNGKSVVNSNSKRKDILCTKCGRKGHNSVSCWTKGVGKGSKSR